MAKYFDKNGYFSISSIMQDKQSFFFILGGRGIGKTFSATSYLCDHASMDHKFIFMRRSENEIQFVNTGNIYAEHHENVTLDKKGKFAHVIREGEVIGYHLALSTIHNIRGFSMQDVDYILFDEFIPERGSVTRKFAGEQMLNAYETINRNRELSGKTPVKCIFLSNFNSLESDIMLSFGFRNEIYALRESRPLGILSDDVKKLIMINESPISAKKKKTVLYQAAHDHEFEKMAIENDGVISLMPIKHYGRTAYEYLGVIGEVAVNRLFSGNYYLTWAKNPKEEIAAKDLLRFSGVFQAYILDNVCTNSDYIAQKFVDYYQK